MVWCDIAQAAHRVLRMKPATLPALGLALFFTSRSCLSLYLFLAEFRISVRQLSSVLPAWGAVESVGFENACEQCNVNKRRSPSAPPLGHQLCPCPFPWLGGGRLIQLRHSALSSLPTPLYQGHVIPGSLSLRVLWCQGACHRESCDHREPVTEGHTWGSCDHRLPII